MIIFSALLPRPLGLCYGVHDGMGQRTHPIHAGLPSDLRHP
jgi:hypothetical protein